MKKFLTIFLAVLLVVAMAIPTFAAEHNIPSPPDGLYDVENYPYAVVTYNNGYWLTVSSQEFYRYAGAQEINFDGAYTTYKLNQTSGTWVKQGSYTGGSVIDHYETVIYSSHDIYLIGFGPDGDYVKGSVFISATPDFFQPPPPLSEMIQGVAMETLQQTTLPQVGGTIATLTLCGVGLMAFLVVLSLFGKRSLIFRS